MDRRRKKSGSSGDAETPTIAGGLRDVLPDTPAGLMGVRISSWGTSPDVNVLLLLSLILVGLFAMPFAMAWLEPKPKRAPSHGAASRRLGS